jgi:adenine phosphoribosyltransferase
MDKVRATIRDVPDFPKKGIVFKDITPVLADGELLRNVIDALVEQWSSESIDKILGIESRGFIVGAPLAYALRIGMVVARKIGKLPPTTVQESYALEYGTSALEIRTDAIAPGERVLVVDDLLATGGTAEAAGKLVTRQQGILVGYSFLVELAFLNGARRLRPDKVHALVQYTS